MAYTASAKLGRQVARAFSSDGLHANLGLARMRSGARLGRPAGAMGAIYGHGDVPHRFYSDRPTEKDKSDFQKRQFHLMRQAYMLHQQKVKQNELQLQQEATAALLKQKEVECVVRESEAKKSAADSKESMEREWALLDGERECLKLQQEAAATKEFDVERKHAAMKVVEDQSIIERAEMDEEWFRIGVDKIALRAKLKQSGDGPRKSGDGSRNAGDGSRNAADGSGNAGDGQKKWYKYYYYSIFPDGLPLDFGTLLLALLLCSTEGVVPPLMEHLPEEYALYGAVLEVWFGAQLKEPREIVEKAHELVKEREAAKVVAIKA